MRLGTAPPGSTPGPNPSSTRGMWPLRDRPAIVWLLLAALLALAHQFVPSARWLLVHVVLLGAITHSIMVWSSYFAQALLKTPPTLDDRRVQSRRLWLLLAGTTVVLVGVPTAQLWLVLLGAAAVAAAVIWHGVQLVRRLRRALPGRFRITIRYYLTACAFLPVGLTFGVLLARGGPWHGRFLVGHTMINLLGWVGLTIIGTLLTLWPTILRARVDERAERWARQALPVLAGALTVAVVGALADLRWVTVAGIGIYTVGVCWWGRALIRPARARPPRSFPAASVAAGLVWLLVGLVIVTVTVARSQTWSEVAGAFSPATIVFVAGGAAQVLLGALSYLLPVALGGGPAALKAAAGWFDAWGAARIALVNLGLPVSLLPMPSWVRVACAVCVLVGLGSFLPILLGALRARRRALRERAAAQDSAAKQAAPSREKRPPTSVTAREGTFWARGQLMGALAAVLLAIALGVAADPAAAGLSGPGAGEETAVTPTGETTTVEVKAHDMRFFPEKVDVPTGDRLLIELTNTDDGDVHDLTVGGASTDRLSPGESETLDVGVVGEDLDGWCTVAGHRQMGMVLTVNAIGSGQPGPANGPADGPADGPAGGPADGPADGPAGDAATVGSAAVELNDVVDPVLPPLTDERVHHITLPVEELSLEVAPGQWQRRWTFGATVPGPTLHGRVGDEFVITLANEGTMGHSIDFHAGALAPDEPMRTIAPGASLTYTFTAERAGAWMYHCSTDPMSAHIAAGMFGAVVIEPSDLPQVEGNYLLIQSESYLGQGRSRQRADPVDVDAVLAGRPDYVAFNGTANQYDQQPLSAKAGDRVRIWVVDAGPSRASSFHVVGGQFDTVYAEGAYLLRRGQGSFGDADEGGSQTLALAPGQGGFVELTLPEAGHYPFVSHYMVDAERGAHGIIEVGE